MGDEMRGAAEVGRVVLEFLNAGHGTTLILLLLVLASGGAAWVIRCRDLKRLNGQIEACQDNHHECESRSKKQIWALWLFVQGKTQEAHDYTERLMKEDYGGGP